MKKVLTINRTVTSLQKWIRGFLVRVKFDRMKRASSFISGFLRMRW